MRRVLIGCLTGLALGGVVALPASAEELVAIRPGLMCVSADALGRLTLPNGDSRTHTAAPRAEDVNVAVSGGCLDIPLGAHVQVKQAFRNTSQVTYAGPGAPGSGVLTVPNVDFQPVATETTANFRPPAGMMVGQRLPAGAGMTLVVLQDSRLTQAIRDAVEPSGGEPMMAFVNNPKLKAEFTAHPLRNGELLLLSGEGQIIGRTAFESSFATIKTAPLHGMAAPTFLFEVDYSAGTGSTGPVTQLLAPTQQGLTPLQARPVQGGQSKTISLSSVNRELWRIVPARKSGTEEIEDVQCWAARDGGDGPQHLTTYRFASGAWTSSTRVQGECSELEAFPDRSLFP